MMMIMVSMMVILDSKLELARSLSMSSTIDPLNNNTISNVAINLSICCARNKRIKNKTNVLRFPLYCLHNLYFYFAADKESTTTNY